MPPRGLHHSWWFSSRSKSGFKAWIAWLRKPHIKNCTDSMYASSIRVVKWFCQNPQVDRSAKLLSKYLARTSKRHITIVTMITTHNKGRRERTTSIWIRLYLLVSNAICYLFRRTWLYKATRCPRLVSRDCSSYEKDIVIFLKCTRVKFNDIGKSGEG